MPAHVVLLRHGQTDANVAGIIQGHLPTELNALGIAQVERLATRLASFDPRLSRIVSSDLPRALQSARLIAEPLALPVETSAAWRERGYGSLEGLPPDEREALRAAVGEERAGVEPVDAFHARVRSALLGLGADDGVVAVVTHGGVLRAVVRQLRDGRLASRGAAPPLEAIANASIFHLVDDEGAFRTVAFNDVAHLPERARWVGGEVEG